jgi:hypothetical protein
MLARDVRSCTNLNHRRSDAPVRHCPSCGGVVNAKVTLGRCTAVRHDSQRRGGSIFCVDCGEQLRNAV